MDTVLYVISILMWILCPAIIGLILLQGAAGDISSAFGGGGQLDASLGVGAHRKMAQVTGGLAFLFFIMVLLMAYPHRGSFQNVQGVPATAPATQPAKPAAQPEAKPEAAKPADPLPEAAKPAAPAAAPEAAKPAEAAAPAAEAKPVEPAAPAVAPEAKPEAVAPAAAPEAAKPAAPAPAPAEPAKP